MSTCLVRIYFIPSVFVCLARRGRASWVLLRATQNDARKRKEKVSFAHVLNFKSFFRLRLDRDRFWLLWIGNHHLEYFVDQMSSGVVSYFPLGWRVSGGSGNGIGATTSRSWILMQRWRAKRRWTCTDYDIFVPILFESPWQNSPIIDALGTVSLVDIPNGI